MLTFTTVDQYHPGDIASLLLASYAALEEQLSPADWEEEIARKVQEFDAEVFSDIYVARCTFMSELDGELVGLGSFDPRQRPALGLIGHNAILPEYQSKGLGREQLLEILRRLRERGIQNAQVKTGDHPFFIPAQKMYQSVGFTEVKRLPGKWIEYTLKIWDQ